VTAVKVLVVGGGVGGLCLAQGLRRAGVAVQVFERDPTAHTRGQGYRLRIDEYGIRALAQCLPAELFRLFRATSNPPYPPRGAVFDHHLEQIESFGGPADPQRFSTVANRRTLREVLLAGLGDAVAFGREVTGVTAAADHASVHFRDGNTATGDLVVAADGINSVVRRQILPHAEVYDTGLRGIYGHANLDQHLLDLLPAKLFGGSSPVLGPAGTTLAVGVYQPVQPPHRAAPRIAPYARLRPVAEYVKWTLVAPVGSFGLAEPAFWALPPEQLHALACRVTADWHPALAGMVAAAETASTFALSIRAGLPVDPWPPSRVTLLGDAIHATTPVGGTGANTALRDAALLTRYLAEVNGGRGRLLRAIAGYEARMRRYGFAAAQRSLRGAERIFRAPVPALPGKADTP
jgi:2-polyprenyl-6-methoxyphenol hydroxylase-like FAD-dependent oxidoreductase